MVHLRWSVIGPKGDGVPVPSVPVPLTGQKLVDIFKSLDKNGDGVLCQKELKKAFEGWGAWFPGMPTYRANRGISAADANGDGHIDEAEFGAFVKYALSCGYKLN